MTVKEFMQRTPFGTSLAVRTYPVFERQYIIEDRTRKRCFKKSCRITGIKHPRIYWNADGRAVAKIMAADWQCGVLDLFYQRIGGEKRG